MFLRDIKMKHSLREGCSFLEFFWFVFSLIRTEYEKVLLISPDLVRMRENVDKKNSEHGQFLRSETWSRGSVSVLKIFLSICSITSIK